MNSLKGLLVKKIIEKINTKYCLWSLKLIQNEFLISLKI